MSDAKRSGYCGLEPDDSRAAHSARPDAERAAQRERSSHRKRRPEGGKG